MKIQECFDYEAADQIQELLEEGAIHPVAQSLIQGLIRKCGESPEALRGAALAIALVSSLSKDLLSRGRSGDVPGGAIGELMFSFFMHPAVIAAKDRELQE